MSLEPKPQPGISGAITATRSPILTLLVTAVVFTAAFAAAGAAFMAFGVFGPAHKAEPLRMLLANFLMAGYLVAITSVLNMVAFVVPVACSANWRRLSLAGAAARSTFFGIAAFFISITGLQYQALRVVPIMKLVPALAAWLPYMLPGAFTGTLAIMAISLGSFFADKQSANRSAGISPT